MIIDMVVGFRYTVFVVEDNHITNQLGVDMLNTNVLAVLWVITSFLMVYASGQMHSKLWDIVTNVFIMTGLALIVWMDILGVGL